MRMTENPALQALSNLNQRYLDLSLDTANQLLWEGKALGKPTLKHISNARGLA